jgi:CBS-domain-containing membrane protein
MPESTLSNAMDILATGHGIHRLNVMDGNGRVIGVISQTDILKYIDSHSDKLKSVLDKTVNAFRLCNLVEISWC